MQAMWERINLTNKEKKMMIAIGQGEIDTGYSRMNRRGLTVDETDKAEEKLRFKPENINSMQLINFPPFWENDSSLWFVQVEAFFALFNITEDDAKYRYIVIHLNQATLSFVSDILISPPANGKYEALKQRIIRHSDEMMETKLRKLTMESNEKPSNFLQRLRNLAAGRFSDAKIKSLFLEQLPDSIRCRISMSNITELSQFALQADKITEIVNINNAQSNTKLRRNRSFVLPRDSNRLLNYTHILKLSPELAAIVGAEQMSQDEVFRKVYEYIKQKDLIDPDNKHFVICDEKLMKVTNVRRFNILGIVKYLNNHFVNLT